MVKGPVYLNEAMSHAVQGHTKVFDCVDHSKLENF